MRVTLMHNPEAGEEEHSRDCLLALFRDAGHDVTYQSMGEKGYSRRLDDPADVVVVAGGDGSVATVARRLVRRGVPLAILPCGTANNIAHTLGAPWSTRELVASLGSARRRTMDVGTARAPWGETRFVEAAGVGLFAHLLWSPPPDGERPPEEAETREERMERGVRLLRRTLDDYRARHWHVVVDGEDLSGRYIFVEAMSIRRIGSGVTLAPDADPGDGRLDVVMLTEDERDAFAAYLDGLAGGSVAPPPLRGRRARRVQIGWHDTDGHADDGAWPEESLLESTGIRVSDVPGTTVDIELTEPALEVLVPGGADEG